MKTPVRLIGLCAVLACAAAPAFAVGRLADITLVDRDSGATLPVYQHRGEYWVAGQPGARYAISVRNKGQGRLLAVTSVDGVNVLSGKTAAYNQSGYVFDSWTSYQISGWRKSDSEVAAFEFAAAGDSYAAQTGRPGQVGVIGVALFRERPIEPVVQPQIGMLNRSDAPATESRARSEAAPPPPAAPAAMGVAAAKSSSLAMNFADSARKAESDAAPQKLGTAHGQRETSVVSNTTFERMSTQPQEIIRIRYDSRESLVSMGVIPDTNRRIPQPFPGSETASYVPDPPARRY